MVSTGWIMTVKSLQPLLPAKLSASAALCVFFSCQKVLACSKCWKNDQYQLHHSTHPGTNGLKWARKIPNESKKTELEVIQNFATALVLCRHDKGALSQVSVLAHNIHCHIHMPDNIHWKCHIIKHGLQSKYRCMHTKHYTLIPKVKKKRQCGWKQPLGKSGMNHELVIAQFFVFFFFFVFEK